MPVAAEETTTYALGDVNMDGKIDLADARTVLRYYCRCVALTPAELNPWLNEEQLPLADVFNNDGVIDCRDARLILCYYAYSLTEDEPMPPEEFYVLDTSDMMGMIHYDPLTGTEV